MRLTEASVAIRPRNPWEALDLGVLLAGHHRRLLMTSWALVTLPLFTLLSLVLWNYPSLALFLFWWLKPAYERLPLLILSHALFGPPPSLKQTLRAWPRALKPQLLASLTWRRLSLSRSFTLPVLQLEGLDGALRAQRIDLLAQSNVRVARWLTCVGGALESCFWIGAMLLFYALIPQQVELDWSWRSLIAAEGESLWLEHLTNAFYALILVLWGPVYVACGFTLYLNRRTALEAWDIELTFRRLRQRVIGGAYAVLIGLSLALCVPGSPAMADQLPGGSDSSCPLPPLDSALTDEQVAGPNTPRLLNQTLSSQGSQTAIQSILEKPPFKNPKTVSGWRLPEQAERPASKTSKAGEAPDWLTHIVKALLSVGTTLSTVFEAVLWVALAATLAWIIWRYRAWLSTFVSRGTSRSKRKEAAPPQQMFGLQVHADSLPNDVASAAEKLWPHAPREALSLLYRALLNRLLTDYRLALKSADTEGQVLERIAALDMPSLNAFSRELTAHWQNLAYGHRLPAPQVQKMLCDEWRAVFAEQARP